MRKALYGSLLFLLALVPSQAAVQTVQVTIGASATQVSTTKLYCRWVAFQNNTAADSMRLGDSAVTTSRGVKLLPSGSFFIPPKDTPGEITNLNNWYVAGVQNDVLDVLCDVVNYQ